VTLSTWYFVIELTAGSGGALGRSELESVVSCRLSVVGNQSPALTVDN
jgi:hypothetical protein